MVNGGLVVFYGDWGGLVVVIGGLVVVDDG